MDVVPRNAGTRRIAGMRRIVLLALLPGACASFAQAVDVLRCVAADGSVIYQDRPCAAGQAGERLRLPDDPAPPAPAPADAPVPALQAEPAATSEPIVVEEAGPRFQLCTRADGSQYISDDGWIGGTGVPYGMVGGSGMGLAQVYGALGAGVSAPGLRTAPRIPAGNHPHAGAMIWIDDQCHEAAPREACTWLARRHRDVARRLEHAFSDQAPQLEHEQAALRERMHGCG